MIRGVAQMLRRQAWLRSAVLAARRARVRRMERRFNIDTLPTGNSAVRPVTIFGDPVVYDAMDYPLLLAYLRRLKLRPDDVVYDIGCGMGRILCAASRAGVARCVGIEVSADLVDRARRNAQQLRGGRGEIEVRLADAALADYGGGTVYCMFNPFGRPTLTAVLARLRESVEQQPRTIRIGYNNPAHEDLLSGSGWLRCYDRHSSIWYQHASSFWRSE
jgi:SAM-dependent methyltransferase